MPSTTPGWSKAGPTMVTSTYAVSPMNSTSIAPPTPTSGMAGGRPVANGVTAPVSGSTRRTRPPGPSVTYNAPSGPIALPEPQPLAQVGAAKVASSRETGVFDDPPALDVDGTAAATMATTVISTVNARLESMMDLPSLATTRRSRRRRELAQGSGRMLRADTPSAPGPKSTDPVAQRTSRVTPRPEPGRHGPTGEVCCVEAETSSTVADVCSA